MRHATVVVCLSLLAAATLSAATFDLPTDAQLLARADVVVVATVTSRASREASDRMIFTDHQLRVEDVLKGSATGMITVTEAGGFVNGHGVAIAGSATYQPGTRVLAFLRHGSGGNYHTAYMALGKYRFAGELLVRDADGIETITADPVEARDAQAFMNAIRTGKFERARRVVSNAVATKPTTNAAASAYLLKSQPAPQVLPLRWENGGEIGFTVNQVQPVVDTVLGLNRAYSAWSNPANTSVDLFSASLGDDTNATNEDENDVIFNWNGANPHPVCEFALGCGIAYYNGGSVPGQWAHTFAGENFYSIVSADIVISASVTSQTLFEGVLTHELGHGLGFRHSNEGSPSGSGIMHSSVPSSMGANLGLWDLEALNAVYGAGASCTNVSNVQVSGGGEVTSGQSATLTVTASGTTPFTYQWYQGTSGNTANPVPGATSNTFTTPPITETKQYWVKVSNSCPSSAPSTTVTVTPTVCDPPVITDEPDSIRINPNTSTVLRAAGAGTSPISWQWYRSNTVGDTANPVGTNSFTFTTPLLQTTTSYWVRMSNNCGHDDSALATVTVSAACVPPTITGQPTNLGLLLGQGTTLNVNAAGDAPFTYQWYRGEKDDQSNPIAGATSSSLATGLFNTAGTFKYWVRVSNACGAVSSATINVTVACPATTVPLLSVAALAFHSTPYTANWTGDPSLTPTFELQEATDPLFTQNVRTFTVPAALTRQIPAHTEVTTDTRFYYRVRGISGCTNQPTGWSLTASTVVIAPLPANSTEFAISIPLGTTQPFTQDLLVPGFGDTATNNDTFSIAIDVPWLTVFPASGALSAGGTTVQLTIAPAGLEVGTATATIQITRTNASAAKGVATNDGPVTSFTPFSVTLVTPVAPDPRDSGAPPGTLIIPAVAHADGIGSPFRSDVRIVNVSFEDIDYEVSYTQSGTDGTQASKKSRITISAGDTVAFDDIVKGWFGAGMLGEGGLGTIEIRPLNASNPLDTVASSRTYALAAGGTLGQFIPALRLNQFVGNINTDSLARISLQQVANNAFYRTNLGFVEGSGVPVEFRAKLLDGNGNVLQQITRTLPAYGHLQSNLTNLFGNIDLPDGRVEVETISTGGVVSAYASVLNNATNDPLMVFPVQPARTTAGRYVLAGIAEFSAGDRNFHSDMRIYNAGNAPVTVTLWYYDRGQENPSQPPRQVTLAPGQVKSYNDVLPSLWPGLIGGGSIVATAPPDSSLVLTAQTFSRQADGGTKGQFIPGVTFREATGRGERALEVLQLEQSAQYRSNVGVVEVTGQPATIEITMFEPDSKLSAVTAYGLKANEYIQFDRILEALGKLGTVYNGRVSIRVIEGTGRVYAYGSTIDNRTEDPTYVPGQ
jgi:hypothetical protein